MRADGGDIAPRAEAAAKHGLTHVLATAGAVGYALAGQAVGVWLMARGDAPLWAAGVGLTAHALVIGAYLVHEAAHDNLFSRHRPNHWLGEVLSTAIGSGYAGFDRIRRMHLRHHRDRMDVGCFDYKAFLARHLWLRRGVEACEWAYVPAVELLMHASVVVRPFVEASQRRHRARVLGMLVLRGAWAIVLLWLGAAVLAGYVVAYLLFLSTLQLFDAFHHTYEQRFVREATDPVGPRPSREYERANTYSNLISVAHPWLNVLTLNFGYHNAHHERPSTPWYRLPALHAAVCAGGCEPLPLRELLRAYHRHRVRRVLDADYGALGSGPGRAEGFVGAHGVSFLTVV